MQSIGEALATAQEAGFGRRTGSKVWANSPVEVGQEGRLWRPFNKAHTGKIIEAAERFDRLARLRNRREGRAARKGDLGHIGLEVLRYLLSVIDYRTGALFPAVKTIAAACGRSTTAVHEALGKLKLHGFLNWTRRFAKTGRAGLRGPQVEQASNAYVIMLPATIAAGLAAAPPPDDDTCRRLAAAAERDAMVAQLPLPERMEDAFESPGLAAALARLGARLNVA